MTATPETSRVLRADARRNRDHILDVAQQYFSEHGVTGSLDAIAKQAGVGAGTLYRHFPNRDSLLAALLASREELLTERLEIIRTQSADAADALHRWVLALIEWASAFDGLPEPLRASISTHASPLTLTCQGYITTTEEFLTQAQNEGTARADVRGRDIFLTALATSWARGAALADEASAASMADLARTGWSRATGQPAR
jgi:AcrR family transcriptional regulator